MEKQSSLLKPNAVLIVLPTTSQKLAYLSVLYTAESHKQFAPKLKLFKEEEKATLVATEVTIRNIYVDGISLIVRVEAPTDHIDYFYRSGCTACAGVSRRVVFLVATKKQKLVRG